MNVPDYWKSAKSIYNHSQPIKPTI